MKIPEPLFAIINPAMRLLLSSPLHALMSGSLLLLTFTGRRSGRRYTTPLRYVRDGDVIRCFTSRDTKWWKNLEGGQAVQLRVRGEQQSFLAKVVSDDPAATRAHLARYLEAFPQDADYHGVGLDANRNPIAEDLDRACSESVVVEMRQANAAK